ncbi:MAG: metal-dependent hydrolase [Phycisphaerales bacterium]|nr:metal-dependent hydrolase [Phycisphaerae bacterium]NNF42251.1 metal-dependent hydrolase [Phycisphaerales bacterium]NNM25658.1 metal-dependent hydrolase [Phycisphaerales bacterium]
MFTHAFVGLAATAAFAPRGGVRLYAVAAIASAAPDLDVLLHGLGIQYEDAWGHRGMTHSLLFAAILAIGLGSLVRGGSSSRAGPGWFVRVALLFPIIASHGALDAFTDGGLGIAFLAPFDHTRYFAPWGPLPVPHFGLASMFTAYGGRVMLLEMLWVWLPAALLAGVMLTTRWRRHRRTG